MTDAALDHLVGLAAALVSVGVVVTSVEYLVNRRDYAEGGLYAWSIQSERRVFVRHRRLAAVARGVLDVPGFLGVLAVRAASAAALVVAVARGGTANAPLLVLLVATTAVVNFRHTYGLDGSDQMTFVVLVSLAIYALAPGGSAAGKAAIVFVALQACLAYAASGFAKLVSPKWRGGGAMFAVLNTESYGRRDVAMLLARLPRLSRVLNWGVVAFECAFPLALLGGGFTTGAFALGIAMHLGIALCMGLNSFLWAFVATYPAVFYVAQTLR